MKKVDKFEKKVLNKNEQESNHTSFSLTFDKDLKFSA